MTHLDVNNLELFAVLSNLVLLIPFVTAIRWRRILGAFLLFVECWVSLTYHICVYSTHCLLPYTSLKALDFFFAQTFLVYLAVYLVHFEKKWHWLEWILIFLGMFIIAILQFTLPGQLYVQGGIAAIVITCVIIYWIIYANTVGNGYLPKYDWIVFSLGISLIAISVMMFSIQNIWPQLYWAAHAVWHSTAAMGFHYILMIKNPAKQWINVAERIKYG